jgi:hypothetical protein
MPDSAGQALNAERAADWRGWRKENPLQTSEVSKTSEVWSGRKELRLTVDLAKFYRR